MGKARRILSIRCKLREVDSRLSIVRGIVLLCLKPCRDRSSAKVSAGML